MEAFLWILLGAACLVALAIASIFIGAAIFILKAFFEMMSDPSKRVNKERRRP